MGAFVTHRRARQAAIFIGITHTVDRLAIQSGIGGNDCIHAAVLDYTGNLDNFFIAHVRCNFYRNRHNAVMLFG